MKKQAIVFSILILVVLLAGCAKETTTGSTTGGREYFPNTDGYSWTYRVTSSSTTEVGTMRLTFSGTTTVGSLTVQEQKSESFSSSYVGTSESLVRVTDTEVKNYGSTTYPTTEGTNMIVFPLSVGAKWYTVGTAEMSVIAQEDVTVTAGTYTGCFKVRQVVTSSAGTSTSDMWLAKNVGPIKVFMTMTAAATTYTGTIELTSKNF